VVPRGPLGLATAASGEEACTKADFILGGLDRVGKFLERAFYQPHVAQPRW